MKLLTALSVLPVVALGSTLATDYTADRSLRVERRIHTTSEVVDMVMIVDGEEMEGRGCGGGASERTLTITTVDKVLEHEEGAPTRVRRTLETLSTEGIMSMRGEERDFERTSDAEGAVLDLSRAENGDLEVKVEEGSEPEGADFASLELTLELDALLPSEEVEAGGTWDLESEAIVRGLGMGLEGSLFGRPSMGADRGGRGEGGGGRGGRGGFGGGRGGFGLETMTGLEWKGEAKLAEETETVDELECLVIELELEADGALPEREWGGGRGGRGGGGGGALELGATASRLETTVEVELEGRMLWSLAENRLVSLELEGDFTMQMERTMSRGDREMEMSSTTEGAVEFKVSVEAE